MNPNFFAERTPPAGGVSIEEGEEKVIATVQTVKTTPVNEDVPMTDQKSNTSFDPLFDDDAEGSDVPKPGEHTLAGTPSVNDLALPSPVKPKPDIEPKQPGTDKPPVACYRNECIKVGSIARRPKQWRGANCSGVHTFTWSESIQVFLRRYHPYEFDGWPGHTHRPARTFSQGCRRCGETFSKRESTSVVYVGQSILVTLHTRSANRLGMLVW
jgi:hypothetical protein